MATTGVVTLAAGQPQETRASDMDARETGDLKRMVFGRPFLDAQRLAAKVTLGWILVKTAGFPMGSTTSFRRHVPPSTGRRAWPAAHIITTWRGSLPQATRGLSIVRG